MKSYRVCRRSVKNVICIQDYQGTFDADVNVDADASVGSRVRPKVSLLDSISEEYQ